MSAEDIVETIMRKNVVTIQMSQPVKDAIKLMVKSDVGSVVVVDGERPIGILTERDTLRRMLDVNGLLNLPVGRVASSPLKTVAPTTNILNAFDIMVKNKFRRLPVVENGKLVGVVTETDLAQWVIKAASEVGRPSD